ncbi:MAG: PAS domain S-box protein, partial [Candidatus Lokiarchaeota archaeon]|nr:PAS domain S-box protein [Candidatus Lokiarchaeota archaeon]MBD3198943.1 PAS domain S-box protein [Candidatus Lokiarchaeota archaeon]
KNYAELDLFTSEQISEFNKQIKKIVNGSNSKLIEMEVNRKDGKKIWIEFKCTLIKLDKNVLVETIFKDITEKKNTEQKLKSSEKKYRHLFERDPNALVLTDTKGNILDCNPYAAKLAGYPKQEIIGKNYLDLGIFKERHKQIFAGRLKRFQAGEELEPIELLTTNSDGNTIWLKYQSSTINLDGQILIEAIIQDITEKKESELKLKESEEKFRVIAEQSLLGIAVLQDDVIKYVNQRYADILGYTIDEILAWRPMEYIKMIHPEFRDFMVEQATRKQNGSNDTVENYQFKAIKKDGDEIWCENYSRPIKYQGQFANLITTFEVTERKKAELIIKKEIKKLKELDNLRIDFVNRASHELKTPLTSIYGAIQLMNKFYSHELSDEALDILNIATKGGKRLKKLVFNLLDISRIEARKLRLDKELSDLSSIIRNCVEEMKYLLQQRALSLDLQIPEKCMIEIDKIRIEQVIYNLISNAIKNTPPGGNIYLKLRINNHVILSVKDTGVGLSKKEKRFLFEKFSKLERYGQGMNIITEGSGLGLFISKEIVELHGGKIWATSKGRNKGSTFFVTLPLS